MQPMLLRSASAWVCRERSMPTIAGGTGNDSEDAAAGRGAGLPGYWARAAVGTIRATVAARSRARPDLPIAGRRLGRPAGGSCRVMATADLRVEWGCYASPRCASGELRGGAGVNQDGWERSRS